MPDATTFGRRELPARQLGDPQGSEDQQHPGEQPGGTQALRLWTRKAVLGPVTTVHAHGGDAVVPCARAVTGSEAV